MLAARRVAFRAASAVRGISFSAAPLVGKDFEAAVEGVKLLPERPGNDTMLELYALYKQATVGSNTTPEPGMLDFVGKAKWSKWSALGDMSQDEAEAAYVRKCLDLGVRLDGSSPEAAAPPAPGEYETLKVDRSESGVVWAEMNRPSKKNAISMTMYNELKAVMAAAAEDPGARAVVLTGAGDWYSSGNDLSNFTANMPAGGPAQMAAEAAELLEGFVGAFIDFPLPLVAAVNGPAVGIPVTTLGLCDLVFASHTATLETPFARLGQSPEACSSVLFPRIMGPARANQMLLAGRKITAAEAAEWGLVNEVFDAKGFRAAVEERVEALAALPPQSVRLSKRIIRDPSRAELHAVNKAECALLQERWVSDECMGAIMAFMQRKR